MLRSQGWRRRGKARADRGVWCAGMLAELVYDRADITLFPLTVLESRTEVIYFRYSYVDGGIGLLVNAAQQSSSTLGFLRPFTWQAGLRVCKPPAAFCSVGALKTTTSSQVWIALLATVLGVVVLMHILARLTPLGNYDLKAVRLASASTMPPQEYIIDPGTPAVLACMRLLPMVPGCMWHV